MKVSIGLVALALSFSACAPAVAERQGDAFGQAFVKDSGVVAACQRESSRFRTAWGHYSPSRWTAIDAGIRRMLYETCVQEKVQAP